jgi:hypothetical protein
MSRIEAEVLGHRLVGVQPHLGESEFGGVAFGAVKEEP